MYRSTWDHPLLQGTIPLPNTMTFIAAKNENPFLFVISFLRHFLSL